MYVQDCVFVSLIEMLELVFFVILYWKLVEISSLIEILIKGKR